MENAEKQKILEEMRTILALERNYLAEERTALAEFRTGLTLVLISVPATTVVAFAFAFSTLMREKFFLLDVANYVAFAILAAWGIRMSFRSQQKLNKIEDKKRMLQNHKVTLIKSARSVDDLLGKFIVLEEEKGR